MVEVWLAIRAPVADAQYTGMRLGDGISAKLSAYLLQAGSIGNTPFATVNQNL